MNDLKGLPYSINLSVNAMQRELEQLNTCLHNNHGLTFEDEYFDIQMYKKQIYEECKRIMDNLFVMGDEEWKAEFNAG